MYSVKEREFLAFAKQPGNVPDIISIEHSPKQLKCFNLERPLIVTDNGYYSEENMMKFALHNMKFLTLADTNITWVCETVDALRETLTGMSSTCQFDSSVCGATAIRMHEFGRVRQRSRNGKLSGKDETVVRPLYVHVFFSPNNDAKKQLAFRKDLLELKDQVEEEVEEFTNAAQRKIERYLICSKKGRSGQLKVGFNDKAIAEATKYILRLFCARQQSLLRRCTEGFQHPIILKAL